LTSALFTLTQAQSCPPCMQYSEDETTNSNSNLQTVYTHSGLIAPKLLSILIYGACMT